ncbi:MAG: sugar ABC transporter ATP-binding protein [Beutenbergiaceae bacterium]
MPNDIGIHIEGITKSYSGQVVVDSVDLTVAPGEVVCLLGENGAGKSTVSKIMAGTVIPDSGHMWIDGVPYRPDSPADAFAASIGLIHQETSLITHLSIAENVFLGRLPTRSGRIDRAAMREESAIHLHRLGLDVDPDLPVRELSVAGLQKVEIAKALALDARYLFLDEPTAALGPQDAEQLFEVVDQLRSEGVGFVYVSHRLEEIPRVGTRIVVMRDGHKVKEWDRADIDRDLLVETMVDRPIDRIFPDPEPHEGRPILEVNNLGREGAFEDVSFTVHAGEILGIAGLVGAGRTELARAIFGAEPATTGSIILDGREVMISTPSDAIRSGLALIPEDRKQQGLLLGQSVAENMVGASYRRVTTNGILAPGPIQRIVRAMSQRLELKGRPGQPAGTLSGGNQQKVVIGKWLLTEPKLVMFDEPTRGIDVGAKEAVYELVKELALQGAGVIVVSSELPEVLGLSHKVLVVSRGRAVGLLDRADATPDAVMQLAVTA